MLISLFFVIPVSSTGMTRRGHWDLIDNIRTVRAGATKAAGFS
ncbi:MULTISPECIES: hypothetical protein [unclassified Wolbachia]|nr:MULTISPECIES: hypothetical protein [unclassified Wolbachia]